jgi:hypothetical protein
MAALFPVPPKTARVMGNVPFAVVTLKFPVMAALVPLTASISYVLEAVMFGMSAEIETWFGARLIPVPASDVEDPRSVTV